MEIGPEIPGDENELAWPFGIAARCNRKVRGEIFFLGGWGEGMKSTLAETNQSYLQKNKRHFVRSTWFTAERTRSNLSNYQFN